ncbi:MAG: hypothetical protein HC924_06395 [Synechococcaceae cyanobacterium SM2_3_2]|nr:hypothetical protein [Synechococcaceae cyanobacterium SM2_3_2]
MTDEQLNQRFGQLVNAQLRFQEQLGEMGGIVRLSLERHAEHERELDAIRQRQAEQDQRFDVLLEELRYLIRQRLTDGTSEPSN